MQIFELNTNEPCSIILDGPTRSIEAEPPAAVSGLDVVHVATDELVIASKRRPGLSQEQAEALRGLIRAVRLGQVGPCKFLVLDLAPEGDGAVAAPPNLEPLLDELSDLISEAPVIPVAWARGMVAQADLELALCCSVLVGETDARFSFDVDLVGNLRSYARLAHKLGFVRAERLMEAGVTLDAPGLHELMLLNAIVPPRAGYEGIRSFAAARARRHNSACGIYRAQRLAMLRFTPRAA